MGKFTLELSADDICKIIKQHIASTGYTPESDVKFKMGEVCTGYGYGESYQKVFEGATVSVVRTPKSNGATRRGE